MFIGNEFDAENDSIRSVFQCHDCDTMIETNTDSNGIERFNVSDDGEYRLLTAFEMIEEVNRDRSLGWTGYDLNSFMFGWWEFVESENMRLEVFTNETI